MAPHSSTLAWKIPWTEDPGGPQFMGSLRVGHNWETSLPLFTFMHWRRKWQQTPVFLPGESQGWGSLEPAIYGVAQSRTWLKQLSSSCFNVQRGSQFNKIKLYIEKNSFCLKKKKQRVKVCAEMKKKKKSTFIRLFKVFISELGNWGNWIIIYSLYIFSPYIYYVQF